MMLETPLARHAGRWKRLCTEFLSSNVKQKHSQFMKINPKPNSNFLLFLMKITLLNVLLITMTFVFAHAVDTKVKVYWKKR